MKIVKRFLSLTLKRSNTSLLIERETMLEKILTKLGTTGSGMGVSLEKTLQGYVDSGEGFVYVDGKGDYLPMQDVSASTKECGRADEVLTLDLSDLKNLSPADQEDLSKALLANCDTKIFLKNEK